MDIATKRLTSRDAALLGRVADGVFDEPIDPGRLAAYLSEPGHLMIVATTDGVVVGQCAAVLHRHPDKPTELYIDEVGVAPAFLRRGIARRLLDEMLSLGKGSAARSPGSAPRWTMRLRAASTKPGAANQSRS